MAQEIPVPPDRAPQSFDDIAAKLVDLRGVAKPPVFSGKETEWADFRFRLESIAALLGCDRLMKISADMKEEPLHAMMLQKEVDTSHFLYNLFVQICGGRSLGIVRLCPDTNGLLAWQRLTREYEPDMASRYCAMLSALLTPEWTEARSFAEQLIEWERNISQYEMSTGYPMPDPFKCAVVTRWAPKAVREFLRVCPVDLASSWKSMKEALVTYQMRGRVYTGNGLSDPSPMDISMMKGGGGAKGAGRGGKGGGFKGDCLKCGKPGHMARDCNVKVTQQPAKVTRGACGRYGHVAKDCRVSANAKGKGKGKDARPGAKSAGKGKSRFAGACFKCGIVGHRAVDCRKGGINDLEDEVDPGNVDETWLAPIEPYVQTSDEPQPQMLYVKAPLNGNFGKLRNTIYGVKGARRRYLKEQKKQVEKEDIWLRKGGDEGELVTLEEKVVLLELAESEARARGASGRACESPGDVLELVDSRRPELELLVDSGAFAHVCPEDWGTQWPLEKTEKFAATMANGKPLTVQGARVVTLTLRDGRALRLRFCVMKVSKPIISVGMLREEGVSASFAKNDAHLMQDENRYELRTRNNLFYLPARFATAREETDTARPSSFLSPVTVEQSGDTEKMPKSTTSRILSEASQSQGVGAANTPKKTTEGNGNIPRHKSGEDSHASSARETLSCGKKQGGGAANTPVVSVTAASHGRGGGPPTTWRQRPWYLFEYACERDSRLATWFETHGHAATRLCLPEFDLRESQTIKEVGDMIRDVAKRGFRILMWIALPCRGWSSWQRINLSLGEETRQKVQAERAESLRMLEKLAVLLDDIRGLGCEVAFEWPRGAAGWQLETVRRLSRRHFSLQCDFDGCRYGLTDVQGSALLQKPWRVLTSCERLREPLSRRCRHDHRHGECRAASAVRSGLYTDELVDVIGKAVTGGVNMTILMPVLMPLDADEAVAAPEPCTQLPAKRPSEEEVRRHQLTHLPYAAWCRTCIAAKARDRPHRQGGGGDREGVPVVELDYAYLAVAESCARATVLVAATKDSGYAMARVVQVKGRGDATAVQAVLRFLLEAGIAGPVRLRSDQEASICAFCQEVAAKRAPSSTIVESTPVGSSSSLGCGERMIGAIVAQVRALRIEAETRWNTKFSVDSPIIPWAVMHAAWLHNRFQPVHGMTPFEKIQQRKYNGPIFKFGEAVMVRRQKLVDVPKMDARWNLGLWLGKTVSSDEHMVGTASGMNYGRSVKALPDAEVPTSLYEDMRWTPWMPEPATASVQQPVALRAVPQAGAPVEPEQPATEPAASSGSGGPPEGPEAADVPVQTSMRMSGKPSMTPSSVALRNFWSDVGPTQGCSKCKRPGQGQHSSACKVRRATWEEERAKGAKRAADESIAQDARQHRPRWAGNPEGEEEAAKSGDEDDDDMTERWTGKREREDTEEDHEEEHEGRVGARLVAPVSPPGPPWMDSHTGEELDTKLTEAGMTDELSSMTDFHAMEWCDAEEPVKLQKKVIKCGWVLSDRGTRVKARIVAQELNLGQWVDAFAATPSSVGQRLVAYTAAKAGWDVLIGDVKTAFLHATLPEHVYVLPPPNLRQEGRVWRLNKALYGLRRSPQLWQEHLAGCLDRAGFKRCKADPTLYVHREHGWILTAHVDDLFISAPKDEHEKVKEALTNEMVVKWLGIIERDGWTKFLGREWKKSDHGFIVRVPPRYYERILADNRLAECKAVCTPVEMGSGIPNVGGLGNRECDEDEELNARQVFDYRHTLGQLMWTLSERPDLSFAVKELARNMSKPTTRNAAQLKRVLRYLRGTTEAHLHLAVDQAEAMVINGIVDASWASGPGRKSTSGGVVKLQGFLLAHWSRTQVSIAQSSCEAEIVAMNVGAVEAVFTKTLLDELGVQANILMKSDSTSGIALMQRRGLGRLRHLQVKELWLQDQVRAGDIQVEYVPTQENMADVLTKGLGTLKMEQLVSKIGLVCRPQKQEQNMIMTLKEIANHGARALLHEKAVKVAAEAAANAAAAAIARQLTTASTRRTTVNEWRHFVPTTQQITYLKFLRGEDRGQVSDEIARLLAFRNRSQYSGCRVPVGKVQECGRFHTV